MIRGAPFAVTLALIGGCATTSTQPPPSSASSARPAPPKTLPDLVARTPVGEGPPPATEGSLPDPAPDPRAPDSPPGSSLRYEATRPEFLWACADPPQNEIPKLPDSAKAELTARTDMVRFVVELYFEPDGRQAALFPQTTAQQREADEAVLEALRRWRSCPSDRRLHTRLTLDFHLR